jgi:hypothetical protein
MDNCKTPSHLESVSLREYFERILAEYKQSSADALSIRTSETERRLDLLNNHAERVNTIMDKCILRTEYVVYHEQLKEKVNNLEKFRIVMDTKASQSSVYWAYAFSMITTIIAVIALAHELTQAP